MLCEISNLFSIVFQTKSIILLDVRA